MKEKLNLEKMDLRMLAACSVCSSPSMTQGPQMTARGWLGPIKKSLTGTFFIEIHDRWRSLFSQERGVNNMSIASTYSSDMSKNRLFFDISIAMDRCAMRELESFSL